MTENLHADCVQSHQAGFVRCCLKETLHKARKITTFPNFIFLTSIICKNTAPPALGVPCFCVGGVGIERGNPSTSFAGSPPLSGEVYFTGCAALFLDFPFRGT
jgi:hypothetical protein